MRRLLPLVLLFAVAGCDSVDPTVAESNSTVTVAYEGRLTNGTVFDRSDRATFNLQQVIRGFRIGIVGMTEGESKTFEVAPEDGYGSTPRPGIPANSTLIFDVTLFEVD
ncbi:MAG: FKBP-type peptidyl-prolyl cis-trans isomerase [Bacteroidota bacterium]